MYKLIRATVVVAGLVMALACGQSNPPATNSEQQGSTPGVSARTELTETSRSGPAAQSPDQAQEPTPAVSGQVEPTEAPATGSRSEAHSGLSSFQEVIGGEYPGLLSLPECDASTQLTMAPLGGRRLPGNHPPGSPGNTAACAATLQLIPSKTPNLGRPTVRYSRQTNYLNLWSQA